MSEKQDSSKEQVAYMLCVDIAATQDMKDRAEDYRKEYLDLYAECLNAVQGKR